MAITIEGYYKKDIFNNGGDFKVYSFVPLYKYYDIVKVDKKWGTIAISGILPTMEEDILYKIDVEYSKRGEYDNYTVTKIYSILHNMTEDNIIKCLSTATSEARAREMVRVYPNIIQMIMNNEPIDVSKLNGIGEITLNKIKSNVINKFELFDLVEEYSDYDMTISMLQKLYNKYNNSTEMVKQKMEEDPYHCLCQINRVGFKSADNIIMTKSPQKIDSRQRAEACIRYLLNQNEQNGNTWISSKELLLKFDELAYESRKHFSSIINESEDIYYDKDMKVVSYLEARICEGEIANKLLDMHNNSIIWNDINVEDYREVDGSILTDEQMGILYSICNNNVNILAGNAGCGKSYSMKGVIKMLDDNIINYMVLASTGKAAKVLSQYIGKEVKTIHRGLEYNPLTQDFKYGLENKLPYDIIIIEEFSMIDIYLLRNLLRAIDTNNTKILFIGDPAQIPSVSAGNISFDMLQSNVIPTTLLTNVFRYDEGGLSYVATKIRKGEKYLNKDDVIQVFGTNKDYRFINVKQEDSIKYIVHIYKKYLESGSTTDDIMLLTAYNKGSYGTVELNRCIQEFVNPIGDSITIKKYGVDVTYRVNDKVMQIKNNYKLSNIDDVIVSVFNGDIGVIKSISKDNIIVEINDNMIVYDKNDIGSQLDLAYSMTIHKSQGSSAKNVILITPKAHKFFLNRNILYVAASRSKKTLDHIGVIDVVNSALRKSSNMSRNTYLKNLIEKKFEKNIKQLLT